MSPAARIADMHTCLMSTGPVPHVGGPVLIGCPNVLIGGMRAARMGDMCAHGGTIPLGFPQVNIGEMGGAPTIPSIPSLPSMPGLSISLPEIHISVPSIAVEGMAKLGGALASGDGGDYAHLAGTLASIAVMGKANDAVDEEVASSAITNARNAGAIAKAGYQIDKASAAAGQAQENEAEDHTGILGL